MPRKSHGEHENFLQILHQNGGTMGTMDLWSLNGLMLSRNALGFGVETIDVAYALQCEGMVALQYSDGKNYGDPDEVRITENGTRLLKNLDLI